MATLPLWLLFILGQLKQTKRKYVFNVSVSCLFHSRKLRSLEEWTSCSQSPFQNVNILLVILSNLVVGIELIWNTCEKALHFVYTSELQASCIWWNSAIEESLFLPKWERFAQMAVGVQIQHVEWNGTLMCSIYVWKQSRKTTAALWNPDAQNPPFPGFFCKRDAQPAQNPIYKPKWFY